MWPFKRKTNEQIEAERFAEMEKAFTELGCEVLMRCECERIIKGNLEVIHCDVKKDIMGACKEKSDLEFEKSLEEE